MALPSGQPINGRDVEQLTNAWPPERFAALCDALAWAASGRACSSLPSFTAQVNAKDGGIDAEWAIEIPEDGHSISTPILGPGWNVLQYKKRDLIARDRSRIISGLKSKLAGAVNDVAERNCRIPDRYVLFVNVDLTHRDKQVLKEAILKNSPQRSDQSLHVDIVGAAELAALLNNFPHLRAAYFTGQSFQTWATAYEDHKERKQLIASVDLIGREEDLKRLRSLVDDSQVRVIVVTGPHAMGKSRLALEATRHRPHDVVLALDPRSMDTRDYRSLSGDHGEMVCIVEDPEPDSVRSLIDEALTTPHCKLLLTLPMPTSATEPSYRQDDRVQTHRLGPLSEEHARALLRAVGRPLAYEIEDWILRHAGGIPGVILTAASVDIRTGLTNFADAVGREFESRIEREFGAEALRCARLLSLLTHVGVRGVWEDELRILCELFGEGLSVHGAVLLVEKLERAGVMKIGGSFAHITIPLLANHLAAQALRGRSLEETLALFGRLTESGRVRFLERLSEVKSEEVTQLWEAMFASDGPFGDFRQALAQAHVLRFVVGAVPERVLRVLESGLLDMTREERLEILGELRRGLMWTLEQLLFRAKTSARAIRLVWLLAEAENEMYANNATRVLGECFHPLHPQMPLPFWEQLALLRQFLSEGVSAQGQVVVIYIIERVFLHPGAFHLRQRVGLVPFDPRPVSTYGEMWDYCRDLVDILLSLVREEPEVAAEALRILPSIMAQVGAEVRAKEMLERLRLLVGWVCSGEFHPEISPISGALHVIREGLSKQLNNPKLLPTQRGELENYIAQAEELRATLENANFATRLKRWAGKRAYGDYRDDLLSGVPPRFERELSQLAEEVVREPGLLDAELVKWLLSSDSFRAGSFFALLGSVDAALVFRERLEELGRQPGGSAAFSSYWSGWAKKDRNAAERRLDELARSDAMTGEAIVLATLGCEVEQKGVDRITKQIRTGQISPERAGQLLTHRWVNESTEEQAVQLLSLIVGEAFEHTNVVLPLLNARLFAGQLLRDNLAELAWSCIEKNPNVLSPADSWDFEELAAKLAQDNSERGFRLLERLVQEKEDNPDRWDPLERRRAHQLWNVLYEKDSKRLFSLLLNVARADALRAFLISENLKHLIDQEKDKDLLLALSESDVENARIIADWVTAARPGFWPIAFRLVQMYPHDATVLANLASGVEEQEDSAWETMTQFYEERKRRVEQIFSDPLTPPEVRPWLREVLSRLEREIPHHMVWEYDIDVDALRHHIGDKGSTQRMWAIGRVLKYAAWEDIKRLLTVEDIEEALPQVDLPERKRKTLERALRVWRYDK